MKTILIPIAMGAWGAVVLMQWMNGSRLPWTSFIWPAFTLLMIPVCLGVRWWRAYSMIRKTGLATRRGAAYVAFHMAFW